MSFVQIKTEPIEANDRNLNETYTQTTSSSGEMGEEFENKMQIDHTKRFDFLLKQSEIFTHFISNSTKSTSKGKPKPGFSRHHRKTEREQDGAPSAMKIEDKDYSQKQNLTTMNNRIVPPNGKRKTSSIPEPKAAKISRPTKHLIAQDFQFFPLRLFELLDQEIYYFRKTVANKKFGSGTVTIEDEEAKPLSKEELAEKEALLSLGFTNWTRNDFDLFIKAIVKYGRDNIENIAKAVDGKLPEEVRKYNEVFWERCHELQDIERIMEQIQEGEAKIQNLSANQKIKMSDQVQKTNFVPTKRHIREVLLFFFNLNKSAAEAERLLCDAYGECVPTSSTCERWFVRFRNGDFDIEDRPSQPKKVKDNESLLQEDCDPTQKNAAKTLETAKAAKTKRFKAAKRKRKSKLEN